MFIIRLIHLKDMPNYEEVINLSFKSKNESEIGNYTNLYKLLENLRKPYSNNIDSEFQKLPTEEEKIHETFCGT